MNVDKKTYAVYKGDELLIIGTRPECLAFMGIKSKTFTYLRMPCYRKRIEERAKRGFTNHLYVEVLEDE